METPEQFKLRLPRSLKSRLSASAVEHRRSLNAEIIILLERAMPENEKAEAAATVSAE